MMIPLTAPIEVTVVILATAPSQLHVSWPSTGPNSSSGGNSCCRVGHYSGCKKETIFICHKKVIKVAIRLIRQWQKIVGGVIRVLLLM